MMPRARWFTACALLAACSDPPTEPRVARTQAALDGMPIYQRARRDLVRADGTILYSTARAIDPRWPRDPAGPLTFRHDEAAAVRRAAGADRIERSRARRFWVPYANQLVAAWVVEHYTHDDLVRTIIAYDGRILSRESLVADAAFTYHVFAEPTGEQRPYEGPLVDFTPHPSGTPDGSFPDYVAQQQVTVDSRNVHGDPWLPDGATATRGNNVHAYADLMGTGLGGPAPVVGTTFPYVYDHTRGPLDSTDQQNAAITSLFYTVNWLHDFWYDAGFDEIAGNAQESNYGRGGVEADVFLAEAQDNALGGSRNNANMATPDDGMPPRMQVFLWRGKDTRTMTVMPAGRTPDTGASSFGPRTFSVTGELVLAQDGMGASPTDGCTALTNDVAGKLVLFDRGNCTYKTKTTHAQAAGALAAIITNHTYGDVPPSLGDDPAFAEPLIPTASITREEGDTLKEELAAGTVTITVERELAPELDGSLDATLVAHEFGHYLHHRLSDCNNTMCRALSEGWGDFVALLFTARPTDDLRGAYPFSIYATKGYAVDPAYFGIRRVPYSADPAINALSFRHMARGEPLPTHPLRPSEAGNSEVHNAGEVWASALWEAYVSLQLARPEAESFLDVRSRMARYIVRGLQLAPEDATPLETRDALLAAALAESQADHDTMIAAFARRGFGSCAVAPPPLSFDFVGIVESTEIAGNPQLSHLDIADGCDDDGVLDTGETATVRLRITNQGHAPLSTVSIDVTSQLPGVSVLSPPVTLPELAQFASTELDVTVALEPGITEALAADLAVRVSADGACADTTLIPIAGRLNVDDVPASSATDTFDAFLSYWEPWVIAWRHVRESPLDGHWHADDLALASDTRLTSPRIVASPDKPLTLSFQHRFQFEYSESTAWDGGVIEYTVDDGETWTDISTLADPGYIATITDRSGNPLSGQLAYTGQNAAWPEYETVTLALGDALAGTSFRIRFRLGTDGGTGAYGWDIDDVAFDGIMGTPFPSQRADDGNCDPAIDDPIRSGGGGCCSANGSANAWLALAVLGLLARRRSTAAGRRGR